MPLYIAIPTNDGKTPIYVRETNYAESGALTYFSGDQEVYDDQYDESYIGNYDIYTANILYDDVNDYVDATQIFLHNHSDDEVSDISDLSEGDYYWEPVGVGYLNGSPILLFGYHQNASPTYNEWLLNGTNAYKIYVNQHYQFIEQSISVTSGRTYTFEFYTYSESGYDGIIFSRTQLSSGTINGGSGDARCSGEGESETYTFTPSSSGNVYVYFKTDNSNLEGPDGTTDYTYGEFSYSYTQVSTRTITLNRTWGSGGSSSVTIPESGSYPPISEPSRNGGTFIGYFSAANGGTQYYAAGSGWYQNIPSNISTLYAHWYNDIQDNLAYSMSISYSPNGRWMPISGSIAETMYDPESVYIAEYGNYEHEFSLQFNPPNQVDLYIPGTSDTDGDTSPGTYYLRFVIESSEDKNSGVYSSTVTHDFTLTVTKADQSAPTAQGQEVWEGSTATATCSGGGGQGSIEWSNGYTRSSVGTTYTKCRWTGNTYYNPSPWSNEVPLTVKEDYVTNYDYNGYNYDYWASISIGSGMTCAGGSSSVTASAGHTHRYYYLYASGSTSGPYTSNSSDSVTWSITSNGNSRFSKSGNTLNHDNMCTDTSTDTVVVTAVNSSSSSATSTDSKSIENPITNYDYNASNSYWASISINNKSYLTCSGGSSSVTASAGHTHTYYYLYCSGCTSGPYTSNSSDSVTWSITSNGNSRFSKSGNTLYHDNMTTNDDTDTVVVTAVNSSSSSATATDTVSIENPITNYDYNASNNYWASISIGSGMTCDGGTANVTASAGHTHTYYYLYCSGYTSGPYTSYPSDNVTWSITTNGNGRFSKVGNSRVNHSSMAKNTTTDTVVVTAVNSSNSNATATDRVDITNNYTDSWNNPSISTYYYDTIPAKGGTSSPHVGVSQSGTRTWCSGWTSDLNNYSFSKSYSMTSGNGFSINTTSGIITASNRGTTTGNARTSNTATLTVTGAGSKSSTKTATCTQSANTLTLRLATGGIYYDHEISYNDITQLTVNAIYSSGSNEDVTASASLSVGTSGIVSFGNNSDTLSIYIDDFVGDDWTRDKRAQDWGYGGWDSYISDVIIDPLYFQSSKFVYTGQTFSYSGGTYYLWEQVSPGDDNCVTIGKKYLLTSTINYNTLYSYSIQNSHINDYCPYVAILDEDFNATYTPVANNDYNDWLIKVENSH